MALGTDASTVNEQEKLAKMELWASVLLKNGQTFLNLLNEDKKQVDNSCATASLIKWELADRFESGATGRDLLIWVVCTMYLKGFVSICNVTILQLKFFWDH